MTEHQSTLELLLRYLDGSLPSGEQTHVEEMLRRDATARQVFRDIAQQAVVISDLERIHNAIPAETGDAVPGDIPKRPGVWRRLPLTAAAVVLIAVTVSQFLPGRVKPSTIITVNAWNGPLEWTSDGGRVTESFSVGEQLSGGTMELLAPDSWIEFSFHDQSKVTLTGLSAVTVTAPQDEASKQQQKRLHLKHGHLSATVQPQPSRHPMLVHTPSADLQVLGTQFEVEAVLESTRLTVNEGRVRLKRLIDGEEVDVPAQQSVTASLDDQNGLSSSQRKAPVTVWQCDLRADIVRGKWVSHLGMLGVRLKNSVASGAMTKEAAHTAYKKAANFDDATGSVWATPSPFGSLVVLSPLRSAEQPVLLNVDTRIRVRGQAYSQVELRIGLSVYRPEGGFAGKYSRQISAEVLSNTDGHLEIELPISGFRDEMNPAGSPVGMELVDWWCVAESSSAKVEITSVKVMD